MKININILYQLNINIECVVNLCRGKANHQNADQPSHSRWWIRQELHFYLRYQCYVRHKRSAAPPRCKVISVLFVNKLKNEMNLCFYRKSWRPNILMLRFESEKSSFPRAPVQNMVLPKSLSKNLVILPLIWC